MSELRRLNLHFLFLIESKNVYAVLFPTKWLLSNRHNVTSLSLLYLYFHDQCSGGLHCSTPPVQTFTTRSCQATSMESSQPYFLRLTIVKRKYHSDSLILRDTRKDASINTSIVTSSNEESIVIYPPTFTLLSPPSIFIG